MKEEQKSAVQPLQFHFAMKTKKKKKPKPPHISPEAVFFSSSHIAKLGLNLKYITTFSFC